MWLRTLYIPLALYALLFTLGHTCGLPNNTIRWWAADLLALPVLLSLGLGGTRLVKGQPALRLPLSVMVVTCLMVTVVFEIVLPLQSPLYTADPIDALAYGVGTWYYAVMQRRHLPAPVTALPKPPSTGWNARNPRADQ